MSRLIKIYTDTEENISKIKVQLYMDGISSITKESHLSSLNAHDTDMSRTFELYIDNEHFNKANYIINNLLPTY